MIKDGKYVIFFNRFDENGRIIRKEKVGSFSFYGGVIMETSGVAEDMIPKGRLEHSTMMRIKHNLNNGYYEVHAAKDVEGKPFKTHNKYAEAKRRHAHFMNNKSDRLQKANIRTEGRVFVAMDGDNIGASVERAAMADDLDTIIAQSEKIAHGASVIRKWARAHDGDIYIDGGDDLAFTLQKQYVTKLNELKDLYSRQTGFTITIGYGNTISRSGHAMLYGKLKGKNQINGWTPEVDEFLAATSRKLSQEEKMAGHGLLGKSRLHKSEITIKPDSHRIRKLRDMIQKNGGEVRKGEVEKAGFPIKAMGVDHLVTPKGTLRSEDLHQHVKSLKEKKYYSSHGSYGEPSGEGSDDWDDYPEDAYLEARDEAIDDARDNYSFYDYVDNYSSDTIDEFYQEGIIDDYKRFYAEQMGTTDEDALEQEFQDYPDAHLFDYLSESMDDPRRQAYKYADSMRDQYENQLSENVEVGRPDDYEHIISRYEPETIPKTDREYEHGIDEQRHSSDRSKVFQLNLHSDQIGDLQRAGLWDTYQNIDEMTKQSGHPTGKDGIGWVRYTTDDDGIQIDEIQSDLGQGFIRNVRNAAKYLKEHPEKGDERVQGMGMTWSQLVNSFPEDHVNKINDIIFGGHHPSKILHEGFLQYLRDNGTKPDTPVHIWQPETKAELSGQQVPKPVLASKPVSMAHYTQLKPEHQKQIAKESQILAENTKTTYDRSRATPELRHKDGMSLDFRTDNWKHWLPLIYSDEHFYVGKKDKAPIKTIGSEGLYNVGKPLPVHMKETYGNQPKKMGYSPDEYGKLETQHNPELEGYATWSDQVRKARTLFKSLSAAQELLEKAYPPPKKPGEVSHDGRYVSVYHKPSRQPVWRHNEEISKANDDFISQNKDLYVSKFPEEHREVVNNFIDTVGSDFFRHHIIAGEGKGNIKIRARHLKGLMEGNDNFNLQVNSPDSLTFTIHKRHGDQKIPKNIWTFDKKSSKVFQKNADKGLYKGEIDVRNSANLGRDSRNGPMENDKGSVHALFRLLLNRRYSRKPGRGGVPTQTPQYDRVVSSLCKSKSIPHVASVALISGDQILMGKRNDCGKWTLPGGHMEGKETPKEGALRELQEEAGVDPDALHYLGSEQMKCEDDKERVIHSFCAFGKYDTNSERDPDEEVQEWKWINCKKGLPGKVTENLQSPKNLTLKLLKLQKY